MFPRTRVQFRGDPFLNVTAVSVCRRRAMRNLRAAPTLHPSKAVTEAGFMADTTIHDVIESRQDI